MHGYVYVLVQRAQRMLHTSIEHVMGSALKIHFDMNSLWGSCTLKPKPISLDKKWA